MKGEQYIEAEDYFDMAQAWIDQKSYDKAEECLHRAISDNKHFTWAYITLAEVQAREKRFHEAIRTLKEARYNDPSFDRINYLMAKYAYRVGDFRNALTYIERALELNPSEFHNAVREVIERRYRSG